MEKAAGSEVAELDVRPSQEFVVSHLPHGRSLAVDELQRRLSEVPKGTTVLGVSAAARSA
jgi:rhodanese-related sulfurtransferase